MTAALVEALPPEVVTERAEPGIEERAITAVLACVARHGLGKTTLDDVAREAGCSRATLYRYFPGKQDLVAAAVRAEVVRVTAAVHKAAGDATTLEDAVVAMLHRAGVELAGNAALRFVADFEPELLLPHLTFAGGDRLLATTSAALESAFERFIPDDAGRASEWVARVGLVFWFSPTAPVSLLDEQAVRDYVTAFVLPAIHPSDLVSPRG